MPEDLKKFSDHEKKIKIWPDKFFFHRRKSYFAMQITCNLFDKKCEKVGQLFHDITWPCKMRAKSVSLCAKISRKNEKIKNPLPPRKIKGLILPP